MRTPYVPGASSTTNLPRLFVTTRTTSDPSRENTMVAPGRGAEHGLTSTQTGAVGERTTMPRTTVDDAATPIEAGVETSATATITRRSMVRR